MKPIKVGCLALVTRGTLYRGCIAEVLEGPTRCIGQKTGQRVIGWRLDLVPRCNCSQVWLPETYLCRIDPEPDPEHIETAQGVPELAGK